MNQLDAQNAEKLESKDLTTDNMLIISHRTLVLWLFYIYNI